MLLNPAELSSRRKELEEEARLLREKVKISELEIIQTPGSGGAVLISSIEREGSLDNEIAQCRRVTDALQEDIGSLSDQLEEMKTRLVTLEIQHVAHEGIYKNPNLSKKRAKSTDGAYESIISNDGISDSSINNNNNNNNSSCGRERGEKEADRKDDSFMSGMKRGGGGKKKGAKIGRDVSGKRRESKQVTGTRTTAGAQEQRVHSLEILFVKAREDREKALNVLVHLVGKEKIRELLAETITSSPSGKSQKSGSFSTNSPPPKLPEQHPYITFGNTGTSRGRSPSSGERDPKKSVQWVDAQADSEDRHEFLSTDPIATEMLLHKLSVYATKHLHDARRDLKRSPGGSTGFSSKTGSSPDKHGLNNKRR